MIPLNDGYRGSTTPAVTVTTAGMGHTTSSYPDSVWRSTLTLPPSTEIALAKVTDGRPMSSATWTGSVPV